MIRPIIHEEHGFKSQAEYNQMKEPLNSYGSSLVALLREMRLRVKAGGILDRGELVQGGLMDLVDNLGRE
ncbi:hypothetical protein HMPREF1250_0240 [Megasphaera vaginalis (ex Srinivasan et al. 2021)]|uniref:Uncharacterized protein n=1 Tax=Megasphaera vaginalis (ex Srinivasan et al. 2021) TaxID=1111454 RepID=U7USS6_9FIRM|nr:hypothetical protein HMPREF1250_0240 [Megasphaera vaginalis (ex Srinivasan et al. 2021)]